MTTDRSVVTFPDAADMDLIKRAAARISVTPATFLRMAGIREARAVLNDVPEVAPPKRKPGRPRKDAK